MENAPKLGKREETMAGAVLTAVSVADLAALCAMLLFSVFIVLIGGAQATWGAGLSTEETRSLTDAFMDKWLIKMLPLVILGVASSVCALGIGIHIRKNFYPEQTAVLSKYRYGFRDGDFRKNCRLHRRMSFCMNGSIVMSVLHGLFLILYLSALFG